jgi:hypothetical protein
MWLSALKIPNKIPCKTKHSNWNVRGTQTHLNMWARPTDILHIFRHPACDHLYQKSLEISRIFRRARTHARTHTRARAHARTHPRTRIHTHTHTHTHTQSAAIYVSRVLGKLPTKRQRTLSSTAMLLVTCCALASLGSTIYHNNMYLIYLLIYLFVVYFTTLFQQLRLYSVER